MLDHGAPEDNIVKRITRDHHVTQKQLGHVLWSFARVLSPHYPEAGEAVVWLQVFANLDKDTQTYYIQLTTSKYPQAVVEYVGR